MRVHDLLKREPVELKISRSARVLVRYKDEGDGAGQISICDLDGEAAFIAEEQERTGQKPLGLPYGIAFDFLQSFWVMKNVAYEIADYYRVTLEEG